MTKYIQLICKVADEPRSEQYQKDAKAYLEKKYNDITITIMTPNSIIENYPKFMNTGKLTNEKCLAICIYNFVKRKIQDVDISIVALWNLPDSPGAMLEHRIAKQLGIPIEVLTYYELYGKDEDGNL